MKILIIEDELDIAKFLQANLKSANFTVEIAGDGERGSFLARTNHYDLIILDYNLPKLSGLEVCQEIRAENNRVPIIMLTVRSEIKDKLDLFQAGVDDYLVKPFVFSELLARIKAILKRPPEISRPNFKIGNLEIDLNNYTLKRGAKNIYLSAKEFSLLEYLALNKGLLVSREMIRENVWGDNCDPFSNTIETHILKLRKKIGNQGPLIITIPGRGYRFN
ncbi:MAG: response regulator transcription factor, partial [Candidatus Falkowbacteria bacterium]|nr:response regulator transcription factor [Candidatus Falkowbacteria bacterium]